MSVLDEIADGGRLSIYLQPNHVNLRSDMDEYNECYNLPLVFIEGDCFTGNTRPTHLYIEDSTAHSITFAYTNSLPYYSITFPYKLKDGKIAAKLLSQSHYRVHKFHVRPKGKLIAEITRGDQGYDKTDHGLRESIQAGANHYAVFALGDDRIWSIPVDILYDFLPDGRMELTTENYVLSSHCLRPSAFKKSLQQGNENLEASMSNPNFMFETWMPSDLTYLKLREDGTVENATKTNPGLPSHYEWLKIFEYP